MVGIGILAPSHRALPLWLSTHNPLPRRRWGNCELPSAPQPPQRPPGTVSEHLGVRLHLSPSSRTGYLNVHAHGCRFRAVVQSRVDGVKRVTTIGCYDSAVLAAACVCCSHSRLPVTPVMVVGSSQPMNDTLFDHISPYLPRVWPTPIFPYIANT